MSNTVVRNTLVTLGQETTVGDVVARTKVAPWRGDSIPTLDAVPNQGQDQVGTGKNMVSGNILLSNAVAGALPLSPRAVPGYGMLWRSAIGGQQTPVEIGSVMRIVYTGDSASCKIVGAKVAQTITAYDGDLGSETADSNFGTAGVLDISGATADTLAEIVALINGYTDYSAEVVAGAGTAATTAIAADFTRQAASKWLNIFFEEAGTSVYLHRYEVENDGTERPSLSMQIDERYENWLYNGVVVNSMSMDASSQSQIQGGAENLGFREYKKHTQDCATTSADATVTVEDSTKLSVGMTVSGTGISASTTVSSITSSTEIELSAAATATGSPTLTFEVTASVLTLEDAKPLIFWKGDTQVGAEDFRCAIQQATLTVSNSGKEDGFCQGTPFRGKQQKGFFGVELSLTLRVYDDVQFALRDLAESNETIGINLYYTGADLGNSLTEALFIDVPYFAVNTFTWSDDGGAYGASVPGVATHPNGGVYDSPFTVDIIMPYASL